MKERSGMNAANTFGLSVLLEACFNLGVVEATVGERGLLTPVDMVAAGRGVLNPVGMMTAVWRLEICVCDTC